MLPAGEEGSLKTDELGLLASEATSWIASNNTFLGSPVTPNDARLSPAADVLRLKDARLSPAADVLRLAVEAQWLIESQWFDELFSASSSGVSGRLDLAVDRCSPGIRAMSRGAGRRPRYMALGRPAEPS
jgi:hypothetical protein